MAVTIDQLISFLEANEVDGVPTDFDTGLNDALGVPAGFYHLAFEADSVEHLDALLGQIAAAGATGVTAFGLHLRGSTRGWFMGWLARSHPELVSAYRELYRRGAYLPSDYKKMLHDRVTPLIAKHGLAPDRRSFRTAEAQTAVAAEPLANYIEKHPTMKMLALAFILLVGVALVADGLGFHIPRGYLYFAIAFSLGVELLNIRARTKSEKAAEQAH